MSYDQAVKAIDALRGASAFDYGKAAQYATQVREFVRRSQKYCEATGLPLYSPFVETMSHAGPLPKELHDEILSIAELRGWSPSCTKACREHFKFLIYQDELPKSQRQLANVYEPLFHFLADGGDLYEHHGDICIRDAATVVLRKG